MITIDNINEIIEESSNAGFEVRMCDISYAILCSIYSEKQISYAVLFGKDASDSLVEEYDSMPKIKFLKNLMKRFLTKTSKIVSHQDISFEENKDALIQLLETIKELKKKNEIEAKDAVKLETDIRIKLNDKFDVATNKSERRIIVNTKFNTICEITRRECFLQTKEYAMKQWGLVDLEELKKDYNITPKEEE